MSKWSGEEVILLLEKYPNTRTDELAKILNRSVSTIERKASRLHLKKTKEYLSAIKSEVSPWRKKSIQIACEAKNRVTIEDLCYIAGLFDGEGSVTLYEAYDKFRVRKLRLEVQIANTNRDVLEWIKNLMQCGCVYKGSKSKKQCYHYYLSSWRAVFFLEMIIPYLKIKKQEAIEKVSKWKEQ